MSNDIIVTNGTSQELPVGTPGVTAINGYTGDVRLTQDDIPNGKEYVQYSKAEQEKLQSIDESLTGITVDELIERCDGTLSDKVDENTKIAEEAKKTAEDISGIASSAFDISNTALLIARDAEKTIDEATEEIRAETISLIVNPDYEENDPTKKSYIKNRPFYHSPEDVIERTPQSPVFCELDYDEGYSCLCQLSTTPFDKEDLIGGKVLQVTTRDDAEGHHVTEKSVPITEKSVLDSGAWYFIGSYATVVLNYEEFNEAMDADLNSNGLYSHKRTRKGDDYTETTETTAIIFKGETLHKLDNKYLDLPNNEDFIALEQKIGSGIVNPDYDENDRSKKSHILNRPFFQESEEITLEKTTESDGYTYFAPNGIDCVTYYKVSDEPISEDDLIGATIYGINEFSGASESYTNDIEEIISEVSHRDGGFSASGVHVVTDAEAYLSDLGSPLKDAGEGVYLTTSYQETHGSEWTRITKLVFNHSIINKLDNKYLDLPSNPDFRALEDEVEVVEGIAKGANQGVVYDTFLDAIEAINYLPRETYRVGQNILIRQLDVPDLWVSGVEEEGVYTRYVYVDDETWREDMVRNNYVRVGYFRLSELETQKVDLENYVTTDYIASPTKAGLISYNMQYGLQRIGIQLAPITSTTTVESYIRDRKNAFMSILYLDKIVKAGLTDNREASTWTDEDKANARALIGAVGSTDYATGSKGGVIKASAGDTGQGIYIDNSGRAQLGNMEDYIAQRVAGRAIRNQDLDYAIKVGMTTNRKTLTADEKAKAQEWLGIIDIFCTNGSQGLSYNLLGGTYYCLGIGECVDTDIEIASVVRGISVTSIPNGAFSTCSSITSVVIPDSVTSIGIQSFGSCPNLTNITIGNGVTSIDVSAFLNCSSLTSVIIGNGVTSIGEQAFLNCNGLKDVYYRGTEEQWNAITIGMHNEPLTNATIHYNWEGNV